MRAVKRTYALIGLCGLVFLTAAALRVRSHMIQVGDIGVGPRIEPLPSLSRPPRDYALHPVVAPGEENRGPRRIISLAPSITETVCALGMRDRLVGRTQYCTHPPGIQDIPAVGAIMDTNLELIKSLKPDLVLTTSNSGDAPGRLQALGIQQVSLPHNSLEDIYAAIAMIGTLCDRPRTALGLISAIQRDLVVLKAVASASGKPSRQVLVVLGDLPVPPTQVFVAGPGSFLESLLHRAGQANAVAGVMRSSHGELPLEKLLTIDPEVILCFSNGRAAGDPPTDEVYASWSRVGPLRAISNRRVRVIGGLEWLSAGPRIAIELHHVIVAMESVP